MMNESYHKKKQGGGKDMTSVRTSESLFLQVRKREPKKKVGMDSIWIVTM